MSKIDKIAVPNIFYKWPTMKILALVLYCSLFFSSIHWKFGGLSASSEWELIIQNVGLKKLKPIYRTSLYHGTEAWFGSKSFAVLPRRLANGCRTNSSRGSRLQRVRNSISVCARLPASAVEYIDSSFLSVSRHCNCFCPATLSIFKATPTIVEEAFIFYLWTFFATHRYSRETT